MTNDSGDYAIAFSTAETVRRTPERRGTVSPVDNLPNDQISPLFQAAMEVIGRPELKEDERFKTAAARARNGAALTEVLESWTVPLYLALRASSEYSGSTFRVRIGAVVPLPTE